MKFYAINIILGKNVFIVRKDENFGRDERVFLSHKNKVKSRRVRKVSPLHRRER